MGRIYCLPVSVANQIAAGEVIDRPASVLKELVENSIDAGASMIEVELINGGLSLIRVRDNGIGIVKEDLALSLAPQATSKIRTIDDLQTIQSLGFRGEALASIASVSKLCLISKARDQADAYQCRVSGIQALPEILSASHKEGTTIEVRDLFYNVPVRRRFLKSPQTELQRMQHILKVMALSHNSVGFSLTHNEKKQHYPRALNTQAISARLKKICGNDFFQSAYQLDFERNGLKLWGYLGSENKQVRHAACQYFFVNQRVVKDKVLNHAIKMAFEASGRSLEGAYAAYVLYLTLDPNEVDVNVHPTKQEVRFVEAGLIHEFIFQAISQVLAVKKTEDRMFEQATEIGSTQPITLPPSHLSGSNLIAFSHYYMLPIKDHLLIIDLKKAENLPDMNIISKPLLFPVIMNFDSHSMTNKSLLEKSGFVFIQNAKEVWLLSHIPDLQGSHHCVRSINENIMHRIFHE